MKRFLLGFIAILGITLILQSCNEDIQLVGEFRETAVVYGILDQAETVHYIKVTRAFIGDGNTDANEIAAIPDSSYFNSVDGTVTEYINDVPTGRIFSLVDTTVDNKDPNGIFYAPQQKLQVFYTTGASPLLGDAEYRLNLVINKDLSSEFSVTAKTTMVSGVSHNISANYSFTFVNNLGEFSPSSINVTNPSSGNAGEPSARSNVDVEIGFYEFIGADSTLKSFSWNIAEQDILPGETVFFTAQGLKFYELMAANCTSNPLIDKRRIEYFKVIITSAHSDLVQYIQVSEPSSSLAQSKPTFTNLVATNDHPVIGIFTSRQTITVDKPYMLPAQPFIRSLSKKSTERLCIGAETGPLFFCSNHPGDVAETWFCP